MRKATLLTVMVLLSMTFSMAKEVTLGPDLRNVSEKQSVTRQTVKNVTPWSVERDMRPDAREVGRVLGVDDSYSGADLGGERFEALLEYVNWPIISYGGFGFDATDSALVWFRPATDCTIEEVHITFSTDSDWSGHTAFLQLYSIKTDWITEADGDGVYGFDQLDFVTGDNGPHDELLWEVPIPVTDTGINFLYTVSLADWGGAIDIGTHDFALVVGIPADVPNGQLYYTPFWSDRGVYHSFKYYHGAAGWKSRLNFIMMATVDYYGDPPPFIEDEVDLDDQYLSDDPGPYDVSAFIYDIGTATFTGGLDSLHLEYTVNGDAFVEDLTDQIPSEDSTYTFAFAGLEIDDYVEYSWVAQDNGAEDVPDGVTHESRTLLPMSFTVREANPNATILIVEDNTDAVAGDFYAPILEAGGWVFDFWDVTVSGSPSAGILANYDLLLWGQSNNGAGILENEDNEAILAAFLDAGGNLFLSSSDYIGAMEGNFDHVWMTPTADSFLENYLHVEEYVSDANPPPGTDDASNDTLYVGVAGTLVHDYVDVEFEISPEDIVGVTNWGDETLPDADSEAPFLVYSAYLDEDWVEAGVLYDGDYKLIFLPWQFEAIEDDEVRMDLMASFLDFFGEMATPLTVFDGGDRYAQAANAGNVAVYGSASDGDGEVVSMGVDYTLDGGSTWLSVVMTDGRAEIPALSVGDDCYYMVTATDDDGLTGYSMEVNVWKIDFTPAADVLYVGDDYYTWYYGGNYDSANYARTMEAATAAGLTLDYWDADEDFIMDTRSVLNQYAAVIWNAYADWDPAYMPMATFDNPLSDYVADGGMLLYSSEEMIGTWGDWPQYQDFYPGDFMYDVLNVNWAANDVGGDSIVTDVTGDYTSGLGNFNLESANFAFGNMDDLCDPLPYWGGDFASGPFGIYDAPAGWGLNPASSQTDNTLFLAFSMMMMPDDLYAMFINSWLTTVSVDEPGSSLPREFALSNNYPNPFNPSTTIAFDVPNSSEVMITVYNVLGQKVIDLVNSEYSAGNYNVSWNGLDAAGNPVSSGLYMYKMTAGAFTATSKMLYLK
ncbi:T9SS type A sorting domain-containing protein [bacterium]|nr:T9SS type A sorting domain-containing protein [bacterium]